MSILFVNASQNPTGNTHQFGQRFLSGHDYQEVALSQYKVYQLGQDYPDDQFSVIYDQLLAADQIILGTPVYWHTISAYLKVLMERVSQMPVEKVRALAGKQVYLLVQGADPSDTIGPATKLVSRFCKVLGLDFVGAATPNKKFTKLQQKLWK